MSGQGRRPEPLMPAAAPVTPRASLQPGGEALPLHDQVRRLMRRDHHCVVNLFGPRGAGKTAALRHLASVLPADGSVTLLDEDGHRWPVDGRVRPADGMLVTATRSPVADPQVIPLRMSPWDVDDAIEYLLSTRRDRCASVMERIKDSRRVELSGLPELWRVVLDEMTADGSLASPTDALRRALASRLGDERLRRRATDYCLECVLPPAVANPPDPPAFFQLFDPLLARLLAYRPVQVILGAQRIVWDLARSAGRDHVGARLPPDLVREVASLVAFREPAMQALRGFVRGHDRRAHSTSATILHATNTGWRPEPGSKPTLTGAALAGACWPGVDLSDTCIAAADLSGADLSGADLDAVAAGSTLLRGASLRNAWLRGARAVLADLSGAQLCGACADRGFFDGANLAGADLSDASFQSACLATANLDGARLVGADLRQARLDEAKLARADLTDADLRRASLKSVDLSEAKLSGADFGAADLRDCDLQGVRLDGGDFAQADLSGADLTGSSMAGAVFRRATLCNAGLADVSWPGADLRRADLTGASFHLGSTRSGLVGSVIPCEGSRTGFYTDEYEEQYYRPPEEVRKADLRHADLRGATVADVDFYLVDLRGARYTPDQEKHFRRCGAIL